MIVKTPRRFVSSSNDYDPKMSCEAEDGDRLAMIGRYIQTRARDRDCCHRYQLNIMLAMFSEHWEQVCREVRSLDGGKLYTVSNIGGQFHLTKLSQHIWEQQLCCKTGAANDPSVFTITEKAPTRLGSSPG